MMLALQALEAIGKCTIVQGDDNEALVRNPRFQCSLPVILAMFSVVLTLVCVFASRAFNFLSELSCLSRRTGLSVFLICIISNRFIPGILIRPILIVCFRN